MKILMRRYFSWFKQPEWVFVMIALLSGMGVCFLIPSQAGFDEITQLARIWEISGGYLIPNQRLSQGPYLPAAFLDISYRNQYFYDPVDPNYFAIYGKERIDWNVFLDYQTRSSYLPTLYLPQALAVGLLGRVLDAPVLLIFYTCRMLYLLGYILLTFFAIRLIPFGKWLLAVLALAPTAVFLSATISPDAYTNGACFLFVAWVLRLAFQETPITWKQLWITIGATALLLMVKLNGAFLLPLLLFLVWKGFDSKKMLPILAGATAILFAGFFIGWNIISYSALFKTTGFDAAGQLAYILSHPLGFGSTFFHDIANHGILYLREWAAVYGYGAARVPPVTYALFGVALLAAWLFAPSQRPIQARARALLILTGVVGCFFMILVIYLTLNPVGSSTIIELQGRYFIPIMPALLLGLAPGRKFFSRLADWAAPVVVGTGTVLTLAVYMLGAYLSFYVVCGTSLYTPGLCYQPQYRNWEPDAQFTQPVTQDVLLQQTFTAVCTPLRSVRVWSATASQESAGETLITLKDAGSGAVLMAERVNNRIAADHGWLELTFPPADNAVGDQFMIEIASDLSGPAAGLSFGVTARHEYLYGIVVNNVPADYDLIFQYSCEPLNFMDLIDQRKP